MTAGAALTVGALLVAWLWPAVLGRIGDRCEPTTALVSWAVSLLAVTATFGAGVLLLLLPGGGPGVSITDQLIGCWTALRHGDLPQLDEVVGVTGLVGLGLAAVRFAHAAGRRWLVARRTHAPHLDLLRLTGRPGAGSHRLLWLRHDQPFAYSIGGRRGVIVASTGLRRLPAIQVRAVLGHERAHLRGRHHLIVSAAEAFARSLPFVPLFRRAPGAVGLLVELAADAAAARECGPDAVRAALATVDRGPAPGAALAMGGDQIPIRLQRLARPERRSTNGGRGIARAAVGLAVAAVPSAVGFGVLTVAATMSCAPA